LKDGKRLSLSLSVRPTVDVAPSAVDVRVDRELKALDQAVVVCAPSKRSPQVVEQSPRCNAANDGQRNAVDMDGAAADSVVGEAPQPIPGFQIKSPRAFLPSRQSRSIK